MSDEQCILFTTPEELMIGEPMYNEEYDRDGTGCLLFSIGFKIQCASSEKGGSKQNEKKTQSLGLC